MIVNPHILDHINNNESFRRRENFSKELHVIDSFEKKLHELLPKIIIHSKSQEKVEVYTINLKSTLEHLSKIKNLIKSIQ